MVKIANFFRIESRKNYKKGLPKKIFFSLRKVCWDTQKDHQKQFFLDTDILKINKGLKSKLLDLICKIQMITVWT